MVCESPAHVLVDGRLKGRHVRILIALYLFADRDGFCFPKRKMLADLTGIRVSDVSLITTQLRELGWLTKTGNGGKSRASRYQLKIPKQMLNEDRMWEIVEGRKMKEITKQYCLPADHIADQMR